MATAYDGRTEEEIMAAANQWANTPASNPVGADGATAAVRNSWVDPSSPAYRGPAWVMGTDKQGNPQVTKSSDPILLGQQYLFEESRKAPAPGAPGAPAARPTTATGADILANQPARGTTPYNPATVTMPAFEGSLVTPIAPRRAVVANTRPETARFFEGMDTSGVQFPGAAAPPPAPGSQAPTLDRANVDPLLQGLQGYQNQIANLAQGDLQLSAAEAMLQNSVAAAQSNALGQARSGNLRDRAMRERGAVGEVVFAGQQGARDAAVLRAQEEERDRQFKLDALKTAGDLGLNTASLEMDISKVNLDSATNWINNEFQQLGINKQLSSQEAIALLGFTRDMAAIEYQYDALSQDEQQFVRQQLLDKYQIDEGNANALDQIRLQGKEGRKVNFGNILTGFAGGAGSGAAAGAMALLSDERAKEHVADPTDAEFEALLSSVRPKTFDYIEPEKHGFGKNFGLMAQDLEKTPFGRSMVTPEGPDGFKRVDAGRAGLAALSGLSLVFDRVRKLEQELS